jgi:HPt (histidine-containing phosphotransfer) domain-containing protein
VLRRWLPATPAALPVLEGPVEDWLASIYLDEEPAALAALRAAVAAGDTASVTFAAHTLKGSAGAIGAPALTALCASLEALGRGGALTDAAAVLAELEAAAAAVHDALQAEPASACNPPAHPE